MSRTPRELTREKCIHQRSIGSYRCRSVDEVGQVCSEAEIGTTLTPATPTEANRRDIT